MCDERVVKVWCWSFESGEARCKYLRLMGGDLGLAWMVYLEGGGGQWRVDIGLWGGGEGAEGWWGREGVLRRR